MAWSKPFAAGLVILGVVFLCMFRREIGSKIKDMRSIGKQGVVMGPSQADASVERDPRAEAEALMRAVDNPLLVEEEQAIRTDLGNRNLLGVEAVPVLIRYLAATRIALVFEFTYGLIFGSQLNLLHYLNTQPEGQPVDAVRPFYVSASTQYPETYNTFPFETWLGFLRDNVLVREDGARLRITTRGREFLAYLTQRGYPVSKVL